MRLDVIADFVTLAAFALAAVFVLRIPVSSPLVGRQVKYTLLAVTGVYVLVSVSNILQHTGITSFFDVYEDFAEVLYVPLVVWVVYSRVSVERLVAARAAEDAIRTEHELLTSIVEITPTGILVVDSEGTVSFTNDVAERMLARAGDDQLDLGAIVRSGGLPRLRERIGYGEDTTYVAIRSTPLSPGSVGPERAVLV